MKRAENILVAILFLVMVFVVGFTYGQSNGEWKDVEIKHRGEMLDTSRQQIEELLRINRSLQNSFDRLDAAFNRVMRACGEGKR